MGIKANYKIKVPTKNDFLNDLGSSKDNFVKVNNRGGVFDIIYDFGIDFTNDLAKKLNDFNSIDQGKLIESMDFTIKRFGTVYTWQFSMNEYYKFVDKGVKPGGKFPWDASKGIEPLGKGNVLYHWVKRNNYLMTGAKAPKKKQSNQAALAYLIGRKIQRKGRKGNNFFTSTVDDGRIAQLQKDLQKAMKLDVTVDIKEFIKELKK